ncbi:hypothetical protein DY467_12400 [Rhodopseudomonas sp. BR0G17]|nr:hypothetical protein [Rhodopseudomonas sp. BR0G17]
MLNECDETMAAAEGKQGLDRLARLLARRKAGSAVAAVRREPRKRRLVFALDQNEAFASVATFGRWRRTAAQHGQRHRVAARQLACAGGTFAG